MSVSSKEGGQVFYRLVKNILFFSSKVDVGQRGDRADTWGGVKYCKFVQEYGGYIVDCLTELFHTLFGSSL